MCVLMYVYVLYCFDGFSTLKFLVNTGSALFLVEFNVCFRNDV